MFLACGSCRLVQLPELITRRPISFRVSVHYKPHSSCLRCTAARGGNPYSPPALCFRLSPRASDLDGIPPGWDEISPASHRHRLGGRGFSFFFVLRGAARNAFASADLYVRSRGQNPAKPACSLQPNFQTHGPHARPPPPTLDPPRPPTLPDSPRLRLSPDSPRLSPTLARSPAAQKSPNTRSVIGFRGFRAPLWNFRVPRILLADILARVLLQTEQWGVLSKFRDVPGLMLSIHQRSQINDAYVVWAG